MQHGHQFQFTPLREGRRFTAAAETIRGIISIHAPPRGATIVQRARQSVRLFQFTPLREGRPVPRMLPSKSLMISIHAPPRGATMAALPVSNTPLNFNSRPSARGDSTLNAAPVACSISIHAPPRGATRSSILAAAGCYFNSRPSARGDAIFVPSDAEKYGFQFTPLREGRQQKICNFCKSFVQPLQISMA